MIAAQRLTRQVKRRSPTFTMSDKGQRFLAWFIMAGFPLPNTPLSLQTAMLVTVAVANGEDVTLQPDLPMYPVVAWLKANPDILATIRQMKVGEKCQ